MVTTVSSVKFDFFRNKGKSVVFTLRHSYTEPMTSPAMAPMMVFDVFFMAMVQELPALVLLYSFF